MSDTINEKSLEEFKKTGLLWFVNRILHLFGWVLVLECEDNGRFTRLYPVHTTFSGSTKEFENNGFKKLVEYLQDSSTIATLFEEAYHNEKIKEVMDITVRIRISDGALYSWLTIKKEGRKIKGVIYF